MENKQKEILDKSLEDLIKKVETAGSWTKPFKAAIAEGMPENFVSHEQYKGMNIFMLWNKSVNNGYRSNKWITFKQAKAKKAKVLKGEKATPVFFFKPLKIKEENEQGEQEEKVIPMIKMYYVFNIDQTTLKPDYTEAEETEEETELADIEEAKSFFDDLDFLEIKNRSFQPYYSPSEDYINIPDKKDFISIGEYYSTLGHEYIHSTGHKSRLERDMSQKKELYAFEELIAEIGSVFLMAHLGIKEEAIQDNSSAYLKGWLKALKDDKKYLWKAGAAAQKAFSFLVDYSESKHELQAS